MANLATLLLATAISSTAISATAPPPTDTIPTATATALDGHTLTLPRDLPARATILILGFTKKSADTSTAWEKPIRASLANAPAIGYLDMPFLEDAPALIRPLIIRNIRKQVPDVLKPNFLPLTSNETTWKQLARYTDTAPDAAYILLVDRTGTIRWMTHDPFTPTLLSQLSAAAHTLSTDPK
jgi:hypothetical protein